MITQASPFSRTYQTNSGTRIMQTKNATCATDHHRDAGHQGAFAAAVHDLSEDGVDDDEEREHFAGHIFGDAFEITVGGCCGLKRLVFIEPTKQLFIQTDDAGTLRNRNAHETAHGSPPWL